MPVLHTVIPHGTKPTSSFFVSGFTLFNVMPLGFTSMIRQSSTMFKPTLRYDCFTADKQIKRLTLFVVKGEKLKQWSTFADRFIVKVIDVILSFNQSDGDKFP